MVDLAARGIAKKALLPKPVKIVFTGNSITQGLTTAGGKFTQWFDYQTYYIHTIINSGVNGNKTADLLARFQTDVINHAPDYVVIEIGKNDISNYGTSGSKAATMSNIKEMVRLATINGIIPILTTIIPYASTFSGINQTLVDDTVAVNKMIMNLAFQNGLLCADFYTPFVKSDGYADTAYMSADGLHPNHTGYQLLAGVITRFFDSGKLSTVPIASGTNLVTNADFALDSNSDGIPDGWVRGSVGGSTYTVSRVDSPLGKMVKLVFSNSTSVGSYTSFFQTLSGYSVGDVLEFSVDIMMPEYVTDGATTNNGLSVRMRRTNATAVQTDALYYFNGAFSKIVRFKGRHTVNEGTTALALEIQTNGATGATIYVGRPHVVKVG